MGSLYVGVCMHVCMWRFLSRQHSMCLGRLQGSSWFFISRYKCWCVKMAGILPSVSRILLFALSKNGVMWGLPWTASTTVPNCHPALHSHTFVMSRNGKNSLLNHTPRLVKGLCNHVRQEWSMHMQGSKKGLLLVAFALLVQASYKSQRATR